jgi:uncharacterized protein YndB with AHSA1/START domain
MARNEMFISAPPEAVFKLLADPATYSDWVVGSARIRHADTDWPATGSVFGHSVGIPPLTLSDRTEVLDAEPPVMLKLRAHARPLPSATIAFNLQPEGTGTRITMVEKPSHLVLSLLAGPLGHAALAARNRETLRRLKELAEGLREPPPGPPGG